MEKKLNKWEPILSQMGIRKHIEKISLFCEEKNNRDDMSENKSHTLSLSLNLLSILDLENKKIDINDNVSDIELKFDISSIIGVKGDSFIEKFNDILLITCKDYIEENLTTKNTLIVRDLIKYTSIIKEPNNKPEGSVLLNVSFL